MEIFIILVVNFIGIHVISIDRLYLNVSLMTADLSCEYGKVVHVNMLCTACLRIWIFF